MRKILFFILPFFCNTAFAQQPQPASGTITPTGGCDYFGKIENLIQNGKSSFLLIDGESYAIVVSLENYQSCGGDIKIKLDNKVVGKLAHVDYGTFTIPLDTFSLAPGAYDLQYLYTLFSNDIILDKSKVAIVGTTGIEQMSDAHPITVYPTPATDKVSISLANAKTTITEIKLSDINGRQLKVLQPEKGVTTVTIPVADLPSGMYLLQLQSAEDVQYKKIVVAH